MTNVKPYKRTTRVSLQIQQIMGNIALKHIDLSHLGFITFTHVTISADLRHAKIFYSVINSKRSKEELNTEMNKLSKAFRKYLGQEIRLKNIPELIFIQDESIKHEAYMMQVIKGLDLDEK